MSRSKGGFGDLAVEVIVAGFAMTAVVLIAGIWLVHVILGVNTNVLLLVELEDEGTRINSLLASGRGGESYAELLGRSYAEGFSGDVESIRETLSKQSLSLTVMQTDKVVFQQGSVRSDIGRHIEFPLPGVKRGRLGIDSASVEGPDYDQA